MVSWAAPTTGAMERLAAGDRTAEWRHRPGVEARRSKSHMNSAPAGCFSWSVVVEAAFSTVAVR
jgi:hypothetical protein